MARSNRLFSISTEVGNSIAAITPGGGSYIRNMKIRSGGAIVSKLPEGASFDIICDFRLENVDAAWASAWSGCITVIDTVGGEVRNYKIITSLTLGTGISWIGDDNSLIGDMGQNIMPDHNINLRFWAWGNDDYTPSGPPSESLW